MALYVSLMDKKIPEWLKQMKKKKKLSKMDNARYDYKYLFVQSQKVSIN